MPPWMWWKKWSVLKPWQRPWHRFPMSSEPPPGWGKRPVIASPAVLAEKLISITDQNRIAIVFGPEDRGLTNEDIRFCHELVNIPTADFSSLNLAQAVMVMCYELFNAGREKSKAFAPRLATRHELDGMYEEMKDILVRIDYLKPDNPDYWINKLRIFFTRIQLRPARSASFGASAGR